MRNRQSRPYRRMLALFLGGVICPLFAQAPIAIRDDPLFGTWVLDKDKSKFIGRPALREQIRIFEPHEQGVRAKVVTISEDGTSTVTEYVAAYDGVEYPFTGAETADAVILSRAGPYEAVTTFRHAGHIVGEARRVISPDGKQMTVTIRVRDNIDRVAVFRRAN